MNRDLVKTGLKVKVTNIIQHPNIIATPSFLANRKEGVEGVVEKCLAAGNGGAWWVKHADGKFAPYWFHELEALADQSKPELDEDDWNGFPF